MFSATEYAAPHPRSKNQHYAGGFPIVLKLKSTKQHHATDVDLLVMLYLQP